MLKPIASLALAAGLAAVATPSSAQSCGNRTELVARLAGQHAEEAIAAGLQDPQHLVELWASEDGSTWTLLLSRADGLACIIGAGSLWTAQPGKGVLAGLAR